MDKGLKQMDEKKQRGFGLKFIKIMVAILVPILFLALLATVFMKLAGVDPLDEAKSLIFGRSESISQTSENNNSGTTQVASLKKTISDQQATIKKLQNDSQKKNDQIAELNNQLEQAQNNAGQQQSGSGQSQEARQAVYAQTYKNMDPAKAAAIFEKLSTKQAAEYMNMLDNKTKASILENMSAAKAAALTPMLKPVQTGTSSTSAGTSSTTTTTSTTTSTSANP